MKKKYRVRLMAKVLPFWSICLKAETRELTLLELQGKTAINALLDKGDDILEAWLKEAGLAPKLYVTATEIKL